MPVPDARRKGVSRIGIVGAGASGAITAARILEFGGPAIEVLLFDPTGDPGPGVPYRTNNPEHLLNVVADRMSALDDDPDHFLRWAQERDGAIQPSTYVSRGIYGDYLRDLLKDAAGSPDSGGGRLKTIESEVISIERKGGSLLLHTRDLPPVECDEVVLATGPLPGSDPVTIPTELAVSGRYISDPWQDEWLTEAQSDDLVLITGTGLTAVDAALSLSRSGGGPRMVALSRSALFPKSHRAGRVRVDTPAIPTKGPIELEAGISVFLSLENEAVGLGGDWRDAMDALRRVTPSIWRLMPLPDKQRFLDEFSRLWEIHRFRMAPEIASRLESLLDCGRLTILKGELVSLDLDASGVNAEVKTDSSLETIRVDRVINCTGAGRDVTASDQELLEGLLEGSLVSTDQLGLGLEVTPDGRARARDGSISPGLSVVGPLRRGVEWEAIGITELRVQAARVARRLTGEAESEALTEQLA